MIPTTRFNSISLSISTLLVFSFWVFLNKIPSINPLLVIASGLFISFGIYRTVVIVLLTLLKKNDILKKFVLGPYYLEGTWIGFYIGESGHLRYFIEKFEQELDSLIIRGKSFDNQLNYHSTWQTDTVNIDVKKGKLTYMYEVSGLRDISNNIGVAIFNFERENQYKPPTMLTGYSSDLHIAKKVKAMEIKVSESNLPDSELLQKAQELYEFNKNIF